MIRERIKSFPSRRPLASRATLQTLVIQDPHGRLSGPDLLSVFLFHDASAKAASLHTLLIEVGGQAASCCFAEGAKRKAYDVSMVGVLPSVL